MSTVKQPNEKKKLSLERDRRNTYGENPKSSRKNIAKGKQRGHQAERRAASIPIAAVKGPVSEDIADNAEFISVQASIEYRRKGFKKRPDTPLGLVLAVKAKKRSTKITKVAPSKL